MPGKSPKTIVFKPAAERRTVTAIDRAGKLVARWRTVWGSWVDHWGSYCPGKTMAEPSVAVPGILTRLELADTIAQEIREAEKDARRGAYKRVLEYIQVDRLSIRGKCPLARCSTVDLAERGIIKLMREENL